MVWYRLLPMSDLGVVPSKRQKSSYLSKSEFYGKFARQDAFQKLSEKPPSFQAANVVHSKHQEPERCQHRRKLFSTENFENQIQPADKIEPAVVHGC